MEVLVNAMGSPDEHDARVMALKTECEELERRREAREAPVMRKWRKYLRKKGENLNEYLFKSKNAEDLSKAEEILVNKYREEQTKASQDILQEEIERERRAEEDKDSEEAKMARFREKLPILELKEDMLKALETQSVVVVSGGTGTGKSTQCPQYILEDALKKGRGAETKIIVTQPRRMRQSQSLSALRRNAVNQLGIPSDIASVYMVLNLEVSVVLFSSLPRAFYCDD